MTSHKCLHTKYSASVENLNLIKSPLLLLLYHFLVSLYYLFFTCFLPRTCFAQFSRIFCAVFAHVLRSACSSLLVSLLYLLLNVNVFISFLISPQPAQFSNFAQKFARKKTFLHSNNFILENLSTNGQLKTKHFNLFLL